jgi:membrane-bound lytic murein transglycosylase B
MRLGLAALALTASCVLSGAAQEAPRPSFAEWLRGIRADAVARGIHPEVVDRAFADLTEPLPVVLESDRSQEELIVPLETYLARRLTAPMVRTGQQMARRHRTTLGRVQELYGVPARYLVALWGIESNFGRFTGARPIVSALATLAWDPRRSAFFRAELLDALEILDRGDIELADMRGSWAGAMGQPQFLPSSYLKFAEDFDGDGRRDIWKSSGDVFASIANYLQGHGWAGGERWGREVRVPPATAARAGALPRRDGSCRASRDMTERRSLEQWQALGVRRLDGGPLPAADMMASLVSGSRRHFLVYRNYDALLEYNCAHAYALSVALLGDRIGP